MTAKVSGRLYDPRTDYPLVGVGVMFGSYSTVTDENGWYSIEIPPGTYTVKVRAELRRPFTQTYTFGDGGWTLDIALEKLAPI